MCCRPPLTSLSSFAHFLNTKCTLPSFLLSFFPSAWPQPPLSSEAKTSVLLPSWKPAPSPIGFPQPSIIHAPSQTPVPSKKPAPSRTGSPPLSILRQPSRTPVLSKRHAPSPIMSLPLSTLRRLSPKPVLSRRPAPLPIMSPRAFPFPSRSPLPKLAPSRTPKQLLPRVRRRVAITALPKRFRGREDKEIQQRLKDCLI